MAQYEENEDNVVDQFLVDKIGKAIDALDEPKNLMATPIYSFKTEFRNVLGYLRDSKNPRYTKDVWLGVRRGNLYTLNNLVTELHQINKIQASFSPKDVYEARENINKSKAIDNIKKSLRKIKKEANPSKESSSRGVNDESYHAELDQEQSIHKPFTKHTKEMYRWSSRHEPRKVHGIEHRVLAAVRELVMQNTDDPFKVFGVVGAPGIGKTTFCQSLFGNKFVKEHFSPRIWVCLSKRKDGEKTYKEDVVVRILNGLGIEDEVIDDARNRGLKKLIEDEVDDARKDKLKKLIEDEVIDDARNSGLKKLIEDEVVYDKYGLKKLTKDEVIELKKLIEDEVIDDARNSRLKKLIEDEVVDDARKYGLKKLTKGEVIELKKLVDEVIELKKLIEDARKVGLKKLLLLLRLQLIGKRYLVVLDDAWNDDKFFHNLTEKDRLDEDSGKGLAYGLPKGYGGAVISSSRSKELLQNMFGENVSLQYMEPLKSEIILEIFKDAVIGYDEDEKEYPKDVLDQIIEELLRRCDGIPMAAKLLAKIARENLDIKPKSKGPKPQQTPTRGGESSHVPENEDD